MIASNVMTRNMITLQEDASVKDAVVLFSKSTLHDLPVIDSEGRPVGEVSTRSILHHAVPAYASTDLLAAMRSGPDIQSVYNNLESALEHPVSAVMNRDVQTVAEHTPTSAVAAMLITMTGDSNHVFVVDDDGRLLGLISARDIINRLPEHTKL
jgi:CBS-domain-containing membrane protein